MFRKRIYLDWAAAAPVCSSAEGAFLRALKSYGNPSSPHEEGRIARGILEEARTIIARLMEVKADAVIFTGSATEANALALRGHVRALRNSTKKEETIHMLYLPTAHASVFETMLRLKEEGIDTETIALRDGRIDTTALTKQIRPETALISVELICGETGMRINPKEIRQALHSAGNTTAIIHVDASQAPLVESIERAHFSADLVTLDASKVGGVRGIGVLVAPRTVPLQSIYEGGGQERGLRSGTESAALAAAFAATLTEASHTHTSFAISARNMRKALWKDIQNAFPHVLINEGKEQAPHILNISFPGLDTDYLVALLDTAGFAVSTKSACETDTTGSRVVLAMTGDATHAASTLRISWGPTTKQSDLSAFTRALIKEVRFLEENAVNAKM